MMKPVTVESRDVDLGLRVSYRWAPEYTSLDHFSLDHEVVCGVVKECINAFSLVTCPRNPQQ